MSSTSDWIEFGALLIALITLIVKQWQQFNETSKAEKRTANKLRIFFLCQDTARNEQEIIQYYKRMSPGAKIDEVEIQKTIYEMLRDQTLRYRSNQTFKARRNRAESENKSKRQRTI